MHWGLASVFVPFSVLGNFPLSWIHFKKKKVKVNHIDECFRFRRDVLEGTLEEMLEPEELEVA